MSNLTFNRRQILKFLGAGAALFVLGPPRARALLSSRGTPAPPLAVTPVRLPHPLPIYERMASFLATGLGAGESLPPAPGAGLDAYTVIDDVVVPPEYERYVIVHWGDRVFPDADDYVGYNADYTAFLPIGGRDNDGYLWVNHEYVSYPISSIAPAIPAGLNGRPTTDLAVLGFSLPTGASLVSLTPAERRLLLGEFCYNQGGSVMLVAAGLAATAVTFTALRLRSKLFLGPHGQVSVPTGGRAKLPPLRRSLSRQCPTAYLRRPPDGRR
jgi:uncharacterized protein